jgi:putative flavoprotein involved in K+ transport
MPLAVETLVIGAGQAGLSVSYHLQQRGIEHVVVEQDQVGSSWRKQRWDSFTLVTPNWMNQLPGFPYRGSDLDGFVPRDEVVEHLEAYARLTRAPLLCGVRVLSLVPDRNGGYRANTTSDTYRARHVVVATGSFQKPKRPAYADRISADVLQLHSSTYRRPAALPGGAVLVVGSAQSGTQIAQELNEAGRKVFLSVGRAGRLPRRYRGKDGTYWWNELGLFDRPVDRLTSPTDRYRGNPHMSGKAGGRTINLRGFAKDGITLVGRLTDADERHVYFADDLPSCLRYADEFATNFKRGVDRYIEKKGWRIPPGDGQGDDPVIDGLDPQNIPSIDLRAENISTIVWAAGYSTDFDWIRLPVTSTDGVPLQRRGTTDFPGLYFCGLHWLHTLKSGLLFGVGEDAAVVASEIAVRRG